MKIKLSKIQWEQIGRQTGWIKTSIAQKINTWKEIRDREDPDGKNHDLKLSCCKCGNISTCRCSKPKREFLGVCDKCLEKKLL